MFCNECDRKLEVYETRVLGDEVYRRRHCARCNSTVVTKEEITDLLTIPSSGGVRRVPKKKPVISAHSPFNLGAQNAGD